MNKLSKTTRIRLAVIIFGLVYLAIAISEAFALKYCDAAICAVLGIGILSFGVMMPEVPK